MAVALGTAVSMAMAALLQHLSVILLYQKEGYTTPSTLGRWRFTASGNTEFFFLVLFGYCFSNSASYSDFEFFV